MTIFLVWEKEKWFLDKISNRDTIIQPREPKFKVDQNVIYRKNKVKVEWANCSIDEFGNETFWYDVKKGNQHSICCLEDELKYLKE